MSTILKTSEEIKAVLAVDNFEFDTIKPYLKQADRRYITPYIGNAMFTEITETAPTEGNAKAVFDLLAEAEANLGYFRYTPLGSVHVTDSGIMVSENQNAKNAEWWKVRDLKRSFLDTGFEAIDDALRIMEENESEFTAWKASSGYTIFKELFTTKTDDFQRWYNIMRSRRVFVALRPFLLQAQIQYLLPFLGTETAALIKTASTTVLKQALDYAQAAQVNYAVATAAASGIIAITQTDVTLKQNELPGTKTTAQDEKQLEKLVAERNKAADEFLSLLKTHIKNNATTFPEFNTETKVPNINALNLKSMLSI